MRYIREVLDGTPDKPNGQPTTNSARIRRDYFPASLIILRKLKLYTLAGEPSDVNNKNRRQTWSTYHHNHLRASQTTDVTYTCSSTI